MPDSQTLSEEGKFSLRVLAELNTFVHRPDGVCLGQELVPDALSRSDSDCEGDASVSDRRGFGQAPHVADSPLG